MMWDKKGKRHAKVPDPHSAHFGFFGLQPARRSAVGASHPNH
jgi:hypothetical protein